MPTITGYDGVRTEEPRDFRGIQCASDQAKRAWKDDNYATNVWFYEPHNMIWDSNSIKGSRAGGPLEWHPPLVGRIQPSDQTFGHRHAGGEPDDDQHHLFRAQWHPT